MRPLRHAADNESERKRERHKCPKCNHQYVCDGCWIRMQEPDYVHQSYDEKVDHWLTGK